MITRRRLIALLASLPASLAASWPATALAQGISSRGVRPQPRGKPSGRPFQARLTDVGAKAGLTRPTTYGGVDSKRYIIEVVGCGAAFLDYDNDGRPDLIVTDLSNERYRLFRERGWQFSRSDRSIGRRRGDAALFGLEYAICRL